MTSSSMNSKFYFDTVAQSLEGFTPYSIIFDSPSQTPSGILMLAYIDPKGSKKANSRTFYMFQINT